LTSYAIMNNFLCSGKLFNNTQMEHAIFEKDVIVHD